MMSSQTFTKTEEIAAAIADLCGKNIAETEAVRGVYPCGVEGCSFTAGHAEHKRADKLAAVLVTEDGDVAPLCKKHYGFACLVIDERGRLERFLKTATSNKLVETQEQLDVLGGKFAVYKSLAEAMRNLKPVDDKKTDDEPPPSGQREVARPMCTTALTPEVLDLTSGRLIFKMDDDECICSCVSCNKAAGDALILRNGMAWGICNPHADAGMRFRLALKELGTDEQRKLPTLYVFNSASRLVGFARNYFDYAEDGDDTGAMQAPSPATKQSSPPAPAPATKPTVDNTALKALTSDLVTGELVAKTDGQCSCKTCTQPAGLAVVVRDDKAFLVCQPHKSAGGQYIETWTASRNAGLTDREIQKTVGPRLTLFSSEIVMLQKTALWNCVPHLAKSGESSVYVPPSEPPKPAPIEKLFVNLANWDGITEVPARKPRIVRPSAEFHGIPEAERVGRGLGMLSKRSKTAEKKRREEEAKKLAADSRAEKQIAPAKPSTSPPSAKTSDESEKDEAIAKTRRAEARKHLMLLAHFADDSMTYEATLKDFVSASANQWTEIPSVFDRAEAVLPKLADARSIVVLTITLFHADSTKLEATLENPAGAVEEDWVSVELAMQRVKKSDAFMVEFMNRFTEAYAILDHYRQTNMVTPNEERISNARRAYELLTQFRTEKLAKIAASSPAPTGSKGSAQKIMASKSDDDGKKKGKKNRDGDDKSQRKGNRAQ